MAVLTPAEIDEVWGDLCEGGWSPSDNTKNDYRAAMVAVGAFIDANGATLNAAFPLPFRTSASLQEKAVILAFAALKKAFPGLRFKQFRRSI